MKCALSDAALQVLLGEDVPYGDLTTRALGMGDHPARMAMTARRAMRLCGSEEAARLIELTGGQVVRTLGSGTSLSEGGEILLAEGSAAALHLAWKTAQTLMEHLSGMATSAAEILTLLAEAGCAIPLACTRKNFPGTRVLVAKAVRAGGAVAHRLGLSETLLVFPEHRVFVDKAAIPQRLAMVRHAYPEKKLVAEACDLAEALWLAECGVDVLQLERFSPAALEECKLALQARKLGTLLAPAGGVTRDNAVAYARAGADFLVSSAPYFAPPCDIKVHFSRA